MMDASVFIPLPGGDNAEVRADRENQNICVQEKAALATSYRYLPYRISQRLMDSIFGRYE
jgi:hypothetical protein